MSAFGVLRGEFFLRGFISLLSATIVGGIGWWAGEKTLGIWGAVVLSGIGSGVGLYYGRKIAKDMMGL